MSSSASANDTKPGFRRGRECLRDVAAIEGSTEAHVRRALSRHKRMFPCLSILCKDRGSGSSPFCPRVIRSQACGGGG